MPQHNSPLRRASCHRLFAALIPALLLNACSTEAWYESVKSGRIHDCERLQGSAREECLEGLNRRTYDEYQREKDALK